jgi:predicted RNA-binding protein with PIN domain
METSVTTTIISTGGAVLVGLGGMWISANQIGKRIDDLTTRVNRLEDRFAAELKDLRQELAAFKEVVNGKFRDLDSEIGKVMDKIK